jgi:hypothetical protein
LSLENVLGRFFVTFSVTFLRTESQGLQVVDTFPFLLRNLQKYARGRGKYMYDRVAKYGTRWWYKYAQKRNGRNMHEGRQKCVREHGKKSHKWMVKISTMNLQTYARGDGQYVFEGVVKNCTRWWYKENTTRRQTFVDQDWRCCVHCCARGHHHPWFKEFKI